MQNAICKGRVLPDGLGLNQCLIDWKTPSPDPGSAIRCASTNAFSKLKLNFRRTRKVDSAAAPFILNLKRGDSGHSLIDLTMAAMISVMF